MRIASRPVVLVAAALTAFTVVSPAFAATSVKAHPTALTALAHEGAVAPKHTDTVSLMLRSRTAGVAGEEANFLVRSRREVSRTSKWSAWTPVAATAAANKGHYTISVTMPTKAKRGQKEQYEVKFAGDAANHLASSHSQVFTVRAG